MKTLFMPFVKALSVYILALLFSGIFCIPFSAKTQPQLTFKPLIKNLSKPLEIKNAGDGSGRIFIAEEGGLVKIYKNGSLLSKPFLDLSQTVGVGQYFGIWSIVFSPAYKTDGYFFVFYTTKNGVTILARYSVSKTNADSAAANSAVTLLSFPKTSGLGHYGNLQFGNDGYLYLSTGTGGNNTYSQNGQSFFGKMLRLNVNVSTPPYYSIPPDNPFINDSTVKDEVWQLGLRNAWRWSFDKTNGDMWLADVGQDSMEEIDYRTPAQSAGANFGWQCYEGTEVYRKAGCGNINQYVSPIFEYHHDVSDGGECVTGGYVYRGVSYPALQGYYICVDFFSANAWKIKSNGLGGWNVYAQSGLPKGISSFGEDENAELYAVSWTTGNFYQVQSTGAVALSATNSTAVNAANAFNIKSRVYPTVVENSSLILELKEKYSFVRLINLSGNEVMRKMLNGEKGSITLNLPKLNAGMYMVQLVGTNTFQQKIYIAK